MGRSTQGNLPDPTRLEVVEGETTLAEVLDAYGPPDEWHRLSKGTLLLYRHRRHHFGQYGVNPGFITYLTANPLVAVAAGNLRITYERIQQAEARLAVLVGPRGKVIGHSRSDGRDRLTFF